MRIQNLGPIKDATIKLNKLTVFIGNNGTGKTLAAYSVFAFRNWLENSFRPEFFNQEEVNALMDSGEVIFPVGESRDRLQKQVVSAFNRLNNNGEYFADFFKGPNLYVRGTSKITIDAGDLTTALRPIKGMAQSYVTGVADGDTVSRHQYLLVSEFADDYKTVKVTRTEISPMKVEAKNAPILAQDTILNYLNAGISRLFLDLYANSCYLPAERIGINVFRAQLNAQIVRERFANPGSRLNGIQQEGDVRYPYPIESYINYLNSSLMLLDQPYRKDMENEHALMTELVPGDFTFDSDNDKLAYTLDDSEGTSRSVDFNLTSSSLKSIFALDLFLRQSDNMSWLFIDEPEMNLHPTRQVAVTDLLYELSKTGTPVVVSTHSDYVVKELVNQMLTDKVDSELGNQQSAENVSVYEFAKDGVTDLGDISARETFANFDETTDNINQRYYQLLDQIERNSGDDADE
ncbi:AAA family ATPase [Levilactobacillus fuyuanensis]|uniref:AAA family ATPase n=1 Tax=Levilactobacillus fuyuanensis TaxID=2486022 RepID=A0ABW4H5I9_9LACO|nr:AAA family ATPase [Levilactobacillus fuyuanensis]